MKTSEAIRMVEDIKITKMLFGEEQAKRVEKEWQEKLNNENKKNGKGK